MRHHTALDFSDSRAESVSKLRFYNFPTVFPSELLTNRNCDTPNQTEFQRADIDVWTAPEDPEDTVAYGQPPILTLEEEEKTDQCVS